MNLTMCMMVWNDEKWLYYAISSVLPFATKIIIFDTGSKDKSVEIIKSFKSEKIYFEEKGRADKKRIVELRNEQLLQVRTEWFMIVDGDEIYPKGVFEKIENIDESKYFGIFLKTHMCVGDVFHELPANYGKYELCGKKGNLNMRFYKKLDGWKWWGEYPLEFYGDEKGNSINQMCDKLFFLEDYYWHMSFLKRSSLRSRNHIKYHLGSRIQGDLPEVFERNTLEKRSAAYIFRALLESPFRYIKNKI